jgi:Tfp pilus assembly protein PilN
MTQVMDYGTELAVPTHPGQLMVDHLPRVNLLPDEITEGHRLRAAQFVMAGIVASSLLAVTVIWLIAGQEVSSARSGLDSANASRANNAAQVAELQPVAAKYQELESRRAMLAAAASSEVRWSQYLTDLSLTVPDNVWLTSMTVAPVVPNTGQDTSLPSDAVATITFSGKALAHDQVAVWLESVAKQQAYVNVYLNTSNEEKIGNQVVYSFTSTATVTKTALSNRYTSGS